MKRKRVKSIISGIITGLLIISTLLCIILVVKTRLGEEPTIFGFRFFYIVSGSMEPEIPVNALVAIRKNDNNAYSRGDVITFSSETEEIYGKPNTHRIVRITDSNGVEIDDEAVPVAVANGADVLYYTKGDANGVEDEYPVHTDEIYGKVLFHTGSMEFIGDVIGFVMTPVGFFMAVVCPILIVTVLLLKDYINNYKKALVAEATKKLGNNNGDGDGNKETPEASDGKDPSPEENKNENDKEGDT